MATLAVENITLDTSLTPTYNSAAGGGDDFVNNGRTFLHIKNGSGSPIVATINSLVNCSQGFDHNVDITIPAGSEEMCGPFNTGRFNDGDGKVGITYDDVTTLTVAVIALGA
tara:strand:+ start:10302 stop:10637 length:336 start_codon:yes stop_codon:yes gene_type:complete